MADARVILNKRRRKKGKKKQQEITNHIPKDTQEEFQQAMLQEQMGPFKTAAACRLLRTLIENLVSDEDPDVLEIISLFLLATSHDIVLTGGFAQTPFVQRKWRDRVSDIDTMQAVPTDQKTLTWDVLVYIADRVVYPILSPQWIDVDEAQLALDIELCIDLLHSMEESEIAVPGKCGIPPMTVGNLIRMLNTLLLVCICTRRSDFFSPQAQQARAEDECASAQDQILMHSITDSVRQLSKTGQRGHYFSWMVFYPSTSMQQFFELEDSACCDCVARQFKLGRCLSVSNERGDVAMGIAARYLLVTSWWGGRRCDLALWQHLIVEMVALVGHALTAHPDLLHTLDLIEAERGSIIAAVRPDEMEPEPQVGNQSSCQQQQEGQESVAHCCEDCRVRAEVAHARPFVPCQMFEFMPSDNEGVNQHIHACTAVMMAISTLRRKTETQQEIISPEEAIRNKFEFRWRSPISLRYTPVIVPAAAT